MGLCFGEQIGSPSLAAAKDFVERAETLFEPAWRALSWRFSGLVTLAD